MIKSKREVFLHLNANFSFKMAFSLIQFDRNILKKIQYSFDSAKFSCIYQLISGFCISIQFYLTHVQQKYSRTSSSRFLLLFL